MRDLKRILLLAGEESGVLYARRIADRLRARFPAVEIRGYGEYGFATGDLAVFGFAAVLAKIFFFLRVKRTIERAMDAWRPEVVCTIDYPGLNLKLAAYAKRRGIRAVHVVCPQVWAWHQGRIPKIEASLDALCCFFPFEPALFRPGLAAFVGHPLAAEVPSSAPGWRAADVRTLALLPGSRLGEIAHHLPTLVKALVLLAEDPLLKGRLRTVIPAANEKAHRAIAEGLAKGSGGVSVELVRGGARGVLAAADAAVVASGTATLEAALVGCPTALVYRVGALLAAFLRRAIKGTRYAGLANVIWDRTPHGDDPQPMPELLQENFTAERVAATVRPWLTDETANAAARGRLAATRRRLASEGGDALERIVDCLC